MKTNFAPANVSQPLQIFFQLFLNHNEKEKKKEKKRENISWLVCCVRV